MLAAKFAELSDILPLLPQRLGGGKGKQKVNEAGPTWH